MTKRVTYLDNAATTPVRPEVLEAMLPYLGKEAFGNPSSAHRFGRAARAGIEEAKRAVATALGAEPNQVVFTSGGTEADNLAIIGAALAARDRGGPFRVAVSATEHKAALAAAHAVKHLGGEEVILPVTASGQVESGALDKALERGVAVVSVMWVNNEVGTVQALTDVAHLVAERSPHAVLHTDAVQAAPWLDVAGIAGPADLVTVSAHKLGGPKGTGALVVRRGTRITAEADGGGQERGLRSGTVDVAGAVGFAAALRETTDTRSAEVIRVSALRDRLTLGLLAGCPGAWCNGDRARKVAGNVNIGFPGVDAQTLLVVLDTLGVCASSGSSCSSGAIEPSHVLLAMGLSRDEARASVRLTLGWSSTDADVDAALEVIPDAVARVAVTARHA